MLFPVITLRLYGRKSEDDRGGIFGKTMPKDVAPGKKNVAAVRVLGAAGPL